MATWFVKPADDAVARRLAEATDLSPAIARYLLLRGHDTPAAVEALQAARRHLGWLDAPVATPGVERAVARIRRAARDQEKMVIYGDYDADGVTSTALLYRYLKRGLQADVEAFLPHRLRDGYGVTSAAVARLAAAGVRVIVTCDNGISAHAAALTAREAGIDLIVTDHHTVPAELPDAYAVVHPAVEFPALKDLAGVGVAYLLVLALAQGRSAKLDTLMDFVTVGTVADMVPLDGPNRSLVWAGLERLRANRSVYPGLVALVESARADWEHLAASDIGFKLGPRLNAAGRLAEPDVGFRLLTTNDRAEAKALAVQLEKLNADRRSLNLELEAALLERIDREWDLVAEPFVVLADQTFHPGLTGIVAGRVKERYGVPVLLFSPHDDGVWKASGRSPETVHLYDALSAVRQHLIGFGGHAQAAGCSARPDQILPLREALNRYLRDRGWSRPPEVVALDAELPFDEADARLMTQLDGLEPFGQKNPAPTFGLLRARILARSTQGEHLDLKIDDGRSVRRVRAWGRAAEAEHLQGWVNLTYRLRPSKWEESGIGVVLDRLELAAAPPPIDLSPLRTPARLQDRRHESAGAVLAELAAEPGLVVLGRCVPAGATALDVFAAEEPAAQTLALVGPPPDEESWQRWQVGAARLVLLAADAVPEAPLTPEELQGLYRELVPSRGGALSGLAERVTGLDRYRLREAIAIFREAGVAVARRGWLHLLAPPESDILLRALESYRRHQEAIAFRARWAGRLAAAEAAGGASRRAAGGI